MASQEEPAPSAAPIPMPAPPSTSTPTATPDATAFPLPKILTYTSSSDSPPPELITQGAEGRLYKTTYVSASRAGALKYRPPKPWRHPTLDARLTRHRILAESRLLARCRREGVRVPAVYALDEAAGWLMLEWIDGGPVRAAINAWLVAAKARRRRGVEVEEDEESESMNAAAAAGDVENEPLVRLMRRIGDAVGRLHKVGVVHGDLTTSNMMLRPWESEEARRRQEPLNGHAAVAGAGTGIEAAGDTGDNTDSLLDGEIVIIDFGLASVGTADEDRAVDLYVLERAFASTHPRAEPLFPAVLEAYRAAFKQAPVVLKKLEEVRMRGRKRSMLG
ncbi:serine/threonine-protein kinase bud32 [Diatrype stigma]|uniref:EKC/KEOPS complex subunit BUD32 n=1 Tax=Diatrype stigma TaxID=117547 RepID=A0AAN9UQP3_9PEZI